MRGTKSVKRVIFLYHKYRMLKPKTQVVIKMSGSQSLVRKVKHHNGCLGGYN